MATDILMPKWGLTMKEGKLSKWLKNEGDAVKAGEPIFEVETDKITNTVEATGDGVLFKILVGAGDTVAVKTVVGILAAAGETPDVPAAAGAAASSAAPAQSAASKAGAPQAKTEGGFVLASPIARRLAKEKEIDLADVTGTGPNGRVTEKDVLAYTPAPTSTTATMRLPKPLLLRVSMKSIFPRLPALGRAEKFSRSIFCAPCSPQPNRNRPAHVPLRNLKSSRLKECARSSPIT